MPPRRNEPRRTPQRLASSLESKEESLLHDETLWPDEESDVDPSYDPSDEDSETESEDDDDDSFIVSDDADEDSISETDSESSDDE